jgi:hypothetical protein
MAFVLFAVLAILGLFVLHGPAAGLAALAAMLMFIVACMGALRRRNADLRREDSDRTGIAGWVGGWF